MANQIFDDEPTPVDPGSFASSEKLRADAQALADVRALDTEWSCYDGPHRGRWYVVQGNVVALHKQPQDVYRPWFFDGATPDEARAKAAAWVREQARRMG